MKTLSLTALFITSMFVYSAPATAQAYSNTPLTTELLKQRLDAQLNRTKQFLAYDQQQAEIYAANFAQYQKRQAAALQQMMQQAQQQREMILKRQEKQQQIILDQFSKFQVSQDKP